VGEPTVDAIEIAEFESHTDLMLWLADAAPAFVPPVANPDWRRLPKQVPHPSHGQKL
jgi:hypothetical protein